MYGPLANGLNARIERYLNKRSSEQCKSTVGWELLNFSNDCSEELLQLMDERIKSICSCFMDRVNPASLEFDDLYIAGQMGVLKALDKFDASRGVLFATYATHWIKKSVRDLIDSENNTIKIPKGLLGKEAPYKMAYLDEERIDNCRDYEFD